MIEELEREAHAEAQAAPNTRELKELEIKYLGKSGLYTGLLRQIGQLPPEEKPAFGQKVNEAKQRLQEVIDSRHAILKRQERAVEFEQERIDVTMPGRPQAVGYEHVLQQTTNRVKEVFIGLGFEYFEMPDLESFHYNFEVLNYPPDHPAMDDQDTFYIDDDHLLKTQSTAFQGRVFEQRKPPFRAFTISRTYRNEAVDRTHGHTFHQIDCFMVDEGVSMAHLKGTLGLFARAMLGEDAKVRFRPDFFPFVEPGVDYAISTQKLFNGRWVELGGAGLVHPNILEAYGIDTEKYSGFAFGLGLDRIPMMAYGVDDLRHFLENDLRFLAQFA
jgi:phenylalanyl-tRNA synthetase alpha chain